MVRSRGRASVAGTAVLVASLFLGAPTGRADGISDQRQTIEQLAAQLNALNDHITQIDEEYGAALDAQAALTPQIEASKAKVAAEKAQLDQLQGTLTDIAVNRFVGNNDHGLTPLFSSAALYSDAQQADALSTIAYDTGAAKADDMQSLLRQFNADTAQLQQQKKTAAGLIATLTKQKADGQRLIAQYTVKADAAKAKYGELVQQEADRQASLRARKAAQQAAQQAAQDAARLAAQRSALSATNPPAQQPAQSPAQSSAKSSAKKAAQPAASPTASPPRGGGAAAAPVPPAVPDPAASPPPPPVSGKAAMAVAAARSVLGVPYRAFEASPAAGFDCSGLTSWAWAQAGVSIPHQSRQQYLTDPHVPKDQAQPGDLVFFYSPISHVGIYIGGGQMIDSPHTGAVVRIATVRWDEVVGVARPG